MNTPDTSKTPTSPKDSPLIEDIDISNIKVEEDPSGPGGDLLAEMIDRDDFNIDEDDMKSALDDQEEEKIETEVKREIKEIKEEKVDISRLSEEKGLIAESYEELQEKYKKIKNDGGIENVARVKLELMKKMREKRIQDRWVKALVHFGVNPEFLSQKERLMKIYPFSDFNFIKAKRGEFQRSKMKQLVLELLKFEIINDTYNVECKDITGERMQGTFHMNCKDKITKTLKKGSVVVLKNVSVFTINGISYYFIVIDQCIDKIY
ncbi:unnamed protein product [Moneuplotes crassus]|uniref:Homologous recombination OB-fold protein OB-fold domain-containing protein n=1 Tax=Euplotes crassus TaxID=5936 RepID=A0AAD1XQD1_EUPCR|nr:unnamed protein product [Moneuplotes crassus]